MRLLKRLVPSPAMLVALLALFVATSSGAYAVATLGAKTVGTKQLKNGAVTTAKLHANAVTSAKVADGSLYAQDFKAGQLQSALNGVAAGHTERGAWSVGGAAYTTGSEFVGAVTFPIPLAAPIDGDHTVYVTGTSATHCPGVGRADRGYLCLYQATFGSGSLNPPAVIKPTSTIAPDYGASKEGFLVLATSVGTNPFAAVWGTWAVTG